MKKTLKDPWTFSQNGWEIALKQLEADPQGVFRLFAYSDDWEAELFPSKGLSIGQVYYKSEPILWEPPIGLIHPDNFNPDDDDIYRNGKPAPGLAFIKTYASGIELYGLKNWGIPVTGENGRLLPLHGETSNIPVKEVDINITGNNLNIAGSYIYRSFDGGPSAVWYERGQALFEITRMVNIEGSSGKISVNDTIKNIGKQTMVPDWGYHITFYATEGAKLMIPSKKTENRGGGKLPPDIETWEPAEDESVRTEVGIIHKELKTYDLNNGKFNKALVKYSDNKALSFAFSPSPYTQTWFSNGGANSSEFTFKNGKPVFSKPWNGIGLEIGSSALDHDGNIDHSVNYSPELLPGEKKTIHMEFTVMDSKKIAGSEKEITEFNKKYRKI